MHNKKRPGYDFSADREFMFAIVNTVTTLVDRKLYQDEVDNLLAFAKTGVNWDRYGNKPKEAVVDAVAKSWVAKRAQATQGAEIDVHEMLRRQIGTIAVDPRESVIDKVEEAPYNPAYSKRPGRADVREGFMSEEKLLRRPPGDNLGATGDITHAFTTALDKYPRIARQLTQNTRLFLDSKYRNLSTDQSVFNWGVMTGNSVGQGIVSTLADQVHNINMMQLESFYIPYVPTADNGYKRISLFVHEFANSCALMNNRRSYHIMFETEKVGNTFLLRPQHNDRGRFRFHTPINVLDAFTITFANPDNLVVFLPDRYAVTITASGPDALITFPEEHKIADGERVEISEFTTLNPGADYAVIDAMNDPNGLVSTYVSNTTITVPIDLSAVAVDPLRLSKIFICSRRIMINMRLEYMV
jgi:hypothetical protein